MSPLYEYLGRKSAKVATVSSDQLLYEKTFSAYREPILELINNNFEIGIEIEVERVKPNNICVYSVWEGKADGSLRESGMEYVSVPIHGPRIHYALNQFFSQLPKGYRFSPR